MIDTATVKSRLRSERVLTALGLLADRRTFRRQHAGYLVRCPVHDDRTPSCSVQDRDGVLLWNCHACGESGDALDLIAAVRGTGFSDALAEGAQLAGVFDDGVSRAPAPRQGPSATVRPYPSHDTVEALWRAARAVGGDAAAWLAGRGIADADSVGARVLPDGELPAWASYQGRSWRDTGHRLIVPMFDSAGAMRSVRGIRIVDGDSPKRLPPAGYRASALVMACELGQSMLAGTFSPARVLVLEGEPDFLAACAVRYAKPYARLGIVSGSWTAQFAARIPADAQVFVGTDRDEAGERYARQIVESLPNHQCFRWKLENAS